MHTFFNKSPNTITEEDVKTLVEHGVPESQNLDYKGSSYPRHKDHKNANVEIAKDISSFANAAGGHIVLGVKESDTIPTAALGIENFGSEAERIEEVIRSGIEPRIYGHIVRPIQASDDPAKGFVVVYVPESGDAPHMVTSGGENRYYLRRNLQSSVMNEQEVRDLYERRRRALLSAKEFVESLEFPKEDLSHLDDPWWELVVCPVFLEEDRINPARDKSLVEGLPKEYPNCWYFHQDLKCQVRLEGIRLVNNGNVLEYTSFYRNGCIRFLRKFYTTRINDCDAEEIHCLPGYYIVETIMPTLQVVGYVFSKLGYFGEVFIRMTFHNVTGDSLSILRGNEGYNLPPKLVRWEKQSSLTLPYVSASAIECVEKFEPVAKRVADYLWQAFGYSKCGYFDENECYIPWANQQPG